MATARPQRTKRRTGATSRTRAVRPAAKKQPPSRHGRELWALACLAVAIFLGAVLYVGLDGGIVGRWLNTTSRWAFGLTAFTLPPFLLLVAYLIIAPPGRRPPRGLIWGVSLALIAFSLAAAADTFGLFAGERPVKLFDAAYLAAHGGVLGEALWAVLHRVIGLLGVNVLVVTFFLAGVLLATGSSFRQWARRSGRAAAAAGRAARNRAETLNERRREAAAARAARREEELARREEERASAPQVTRSDSAAHAPWLIDGATAAPDLFADPTSPSTQGVPLAVEDDDDVELEQFVFSPSSPPSDPLGVDDALEGSSSDDEPEGVEVPLPGLAADGEQRVWTLPDQSILQLLGQGGGESPETVHAVSQRLVETLGHFGIQAQIIGTVSGPRVTRYELQLAPGIKVSRVAGLKDDIAYALAATDVRVQAPIPGKTAVGVEVPNVQANYVSLGDIHGSFPKGASPMAFWLGKDVTGKAVLADLVKMVHLLIAGTTGSGKSGCLNALISSILLRATPKQVRMIMIDPKKVELSNFDGVPHLLAPVVTNMKQATYVLDNICREMDRRYDVLSRNGCQDIRALNKKLERAGEEAMPYIMVIIDELADLMMQAPSEVEDSIIRLGQLGRSSGVHVVVATQRPSVDVVTGMIKTNIPSRIAFAVSSQTDSRIILDQGGAESLLGMGDMLFNPMGSSRLLRVQGALITAQEMKLLTDHWRRQAKPEFQEDLLENPAGPELEQQQGMGAVDALLEEAIKTVVTTGAASVALLQRRLRVGYARAGRLIDTMEEMGIISGYDGSKARSVLIDPDELPSALARLGGAVGEAVVEEEEELALEAEADATPR